MRSVAVLAAVLTLMGCGSSNPGDSGTGSGTGGSTGSTTGGCAQALCGGSCCPSNAVCASNAAGSPVCAKTCTTSSECTGNTPPCCQTSPNDAGAYASSGVCMNRTLSSVCLCATASECSIGDACAPAASASGVFTGPYVCGAATGAPFKGCGASSLCQQPDQLCAMDKAGNQFCSPGCTADPACGNPNLACCDAACDGESCCGLCGH